MVEIWEKVVRTTQLLNDGENSIRWSRNVEDTGHRGVWSSAGKLASPKVWRGRSNRHYTPDIRPTLWLGSHACREPLPANEGPEPLAADWKGTDERWSNGENQAAAGPWLTRQKAGDRTSKVFVMPPDFRCRTTTAAEAMASPRMGSEHRQCPKSDPAPAELRTGRSPRTSETTNPRIRALTGTPGGDIRVMSRTLPVSDLEPHANDRLSDDTQAGVVVAGVSSHELVGLIDRDRLLMGGDPFGLFDDDP
jgi:hypothetical protein